MRFDGPNPMGIGDRLLVCLVCGNDEFYTGQGLVITDGATAVGLEVRNPKADLASCSACGHLHTFLESQEGIESHRVGARPTENHAYRPTCL
jgi:hypothetical protein